MSSWAQIIGFSVGLAGAATLAAAENCAPRDTVISRLQSEYSEQLTMGGLQATDAAESVMEIWASQNTGTFTVLITSPDGLSCIVAAGTEFFNAGWAPTISQDRTG